MLIYFQKRNKFEDIHCQRAWTLNSHLTVVHVEPGHLVEPAQAGQSPRWSTCHCTRWGWAHSVSGWPWGTVLVVEQQISPRSKCTTTLWETFSKISKLIWGQLIKVNSTRAFQKIDFNWLIQLILNFSLGRVELISQIHKYPQPNFIIIIINGGNMPVTKTHLTY